MTLMARSLRTLAALSLAASPALAADTYLVDKAHSEASFQVRHFVSKVRGRFTDIAGTIQVDKASPDKSTVEFTIKSASIDTANQQRDTHLKSPDFFDVEKYPEISFKSSKIVAKGKDAYDVTGTFSLHGVSKEITIPVTFLGYAKTPRGDKAGFEVSTTLNRKDYGIVWNQVLDAGGTVLGDDVAVSVNIEANARPAGAAAAPAATPVPK
jgi:polyisoprenoid-binding protein YceI